MKAEIATLWQEAPLSGKYEQGQSALNSHGKLCCLGVLCEVAIEAGLQLKKTRHRKSYLYGEDDDSGFLPQEVMEWADIKTTRGTFIYPDGRASNSLTLMNDNGNTFSEIVEVIGKVADQF